MNEKGEPIRTATLPPYPTATPVRGTQSLVGVMAFVWKHPSLTGLEMLWRWLTAAPMLFLAWHALAPALASVPIDTAALEGMTFFDPVRSVSTLAHQLVLYRPAIQHTGTWWIPLALLVWTAAAALGRSAILRRADPALRPGFVSMALFSGLRSLAFLLLLALWLAGLLAAVRVTITVPTHGGSDPNVVLLAAAVVILTLAAFMLWSLFVWVLDLPPLTAMARLYPTPAAGRAQLRSKLIETNLVMGIVRVALFVLAMTFSASPLPFQSHETQAYINVWWTGVAVFYVLSSDFFHVVRRVTYLRLLQSIATQTNGVEAGAS